MKDELRQKFCRDCYTTTKHKIIEIKIPNSNKYYKKSVCLNCLKVKTERFKPIKTYENELKIR